MLSLEEISDRLEIQQLLVDYSTAIDKRRFDDLDQVFTEDAYIDYTAMGGIDGVFPDVKKWLADVPVAHQLRHLAVRHVDGEEGGLARVGRRGVDGTAVGREDHLVGRAVPGLRQHPLAARGHVAQLDAEEVGFETRAGHGEVGQRLAIGREDGLGVPRRIGVREVLRRLRAVHGHLI